MVRNKMQERLSACSIPRKRFLTPCSPDSKLSGPPAITIRKEWRNGQNPVRLAVVTVLSAVLGACRGRRGRSQRKAIATSGRP